MITEAIEDKVRKLRKEEVGVVLSDKMEKTLVVEITRKIRHQKYGKVINQRKTYYAHDENNSAAKGDTVLIVQTRPLSKLKRWNLKEVVGKAKLAGGFSAVNGKALETTEGTV